jgi:hypothetical protein
VSAARTCLLHIGTHKTGSTALQVFLRTNQVILPALGVFVPMQGLDPQVQIGHHRLPAQLRGSADPTPLLDALRTELSASKSPIAVISSEELSPLATRPDLLDTLAEMFRASGYTVNVLVYLRPQAAFAESMYGERVRIGRPPTVTQFVNAVLELGGFGHDGRLMIPCEYTELLRPFAERFGAENIIARPYPGRSDPMALHRDFMQVLSTLHPPFNSPRIKLQIAQPSINESFAFSQFLETAYAHTHAGAPATDLLASVHAAYPRVSRDLFFERFSLFSREETLAFLERFGPDNQRLERAYGTQLPFTSNADIAPPEHPSWEAARLQREIYDTYLARWLAVP